MRSDFNLESWERKKGREQRIDESQKMPFVPDEKAWYKFPIPMGLRPLIRSIDYYTPITIKKKVIFGFYQVILPNDKVKIVHKCNLVKMD